MACKVTDVKQATNILSRLHFCKSLTWASLASRLRSYSIISLFQLKEHRKSALSFRAQLQASVLSRWEETPFLRHPRKVLILRAVFPYKTRDAKDGQHYNSGI